MHYVDFSELSSGPMPTRILFPRPYTLQNLSSLAKCCHLIFAQGNVSSKSVPQQICLYSPIRTCWKTHLIALLSSSELPKADIVEIIDLHVPCQPAAGCRLVREPQVNVF